MNKNERLKILREKAVTLQNRKVVPVEIDNLTDALIKQEVASVTAKLKDNPTLKALRVFGQEIASFKKDFNLTPIIEAIDALEEEIKENQKNIVSEFENKLTKEIEEVKTLIPEASEVVTPFDPLYLENKISLLRTEFLAKKDFNPAPLNESIASVRRELVSALRNIEGEFKKGMKKDEIEDLLEDLRREFLNKISNIGGGNANRQIFFSGVDVLTKYTDINIKAGSNVTITTNNNNATGKVDVTISATGGGGGAGITRSINSVSTPTAAGNSSSVDYVYLVSGTTTITLPDAAGNTNLYTVKNVGSGVVTVDTTSSQTIDGSLTITLPVQYTSVDIESDTANWNIT